MEVRNYNGSHGGLTEKVIFKQRHEGRMDGRGPRDTLGEGHSWQKV